MTTSSPPIVHRGSPLRSRGALALAGGLVLLSAALRYAAGRDGLWLDEIWTLLLVFDQRLVIWPLDILTHVHHENNHYLNSLWIWLVGPGADGLWYRLPAMLAGTVAVPLAGLIARRRSVPGGWLAMLLVGSSYLLIHYSSEARGYASAVAFALACLECQERLWLTRDGRWSLGVAACAILGVLSQPVFLAFYGALLVWSACRIWTFPTGRRRGVGQWCQSHLPPLAFIAWLYVVDLRTVVNGGGPIYPIGEVVVQTLSLIAGGPEAAFTAALLGLAFILSLAIIWKFDRAWCGLAALGILVMPALLLVAVRRQEVYPRYFVIPAVLILLTLAIGMGRLWERGGSPVRGMCGMLVGLLLVGNGLHVARLLERGRGGYAAALERMVADTRVPLITVGSDHDFRNGMLLAYYGQGMARERLQYLPRKQWPPEGPEWYLVHSLDRDFVPEREIVGGQRHYVLVAYYPTAGLSGWGWGIYRQQNRSD
ncbi:MAG: hypothetical protein ACKV0T_11045 [Planctomycetales bacterium]